jgi:DNA replication and repair protein RecF
MRLLSLRLHDFRSYKHLTLLPPDGVTVFVGENGAGKTNLLEAVHLCCLGRSHRTAFDRELIRHGQDTAAVQVRVERSTGAVDVGVRLYTQQKHKKLLYINGKTASRIGELIGHVTCVMFSPEDLEIVKGAPALRRRFMDMLLSQCQPAYFYALQRYNAVLKQRNALLRVLQHGGDISQLAVWDEQMASACAPVVRQRQDAAIAIDKLARAHYSYISGKEEEVFSLEYCGSLSRSADPASDMLAALAESRREDLRHMTTGFGPHRDDLRLNLQGQDIKAFGSQGQMRTAVLAMRLAELNLLTEKQKETPLLLLDDVLSELDVSRRARLLVRIGSVQTLLTCTDLSDLADAKPAAVLRVHAGEIRTDDRND